jgi:hypothetical protein
MLSALVIPITRTKSTAHSPSHSRVTRSSAPAQPHGYNTTYLRTKCNHRIINVQPCESMTAPISSPKPTWPSPARFLSLGSGRFASAAPAFTKSPTAVLRARLLTSSSTHPQPNTANTANTHRWSPEPTCNRANRATMQVEQTSLVPCMPLTICPMPYPNA